MNKHSLRIEQEIKFHLKEIERLTRQSLFFSKEKIEFNENKQNNNKQNKVYPKRKII